MFAQPSFLKKPDIHKRHYLQLLGFLRTTYWDATELYVEKPLFKLPEIDLEDINIEDINIQEYLRLGNRLERFFSFIIKQSERYEMVAENIQIISNKVTLGEIDFLINDLENNQILHVELAGKLYLYDPEFSDDLQRWIGPNRRDSLERKLNKLKTHQFPLLFLPETLPFLESLNIHPDSIIQKMCMKMRQFLPWQMSDIPSLAYQKNIMGYYVNYLQFQQTYFKDFQYFMPEKQDWIINPIHGEVWMNYNEILEKIQWMHTQKQSPLIWLKKDERTFETLFVTFW